MQQISLKLPAKMLEELTDISRRKNVARTNLIRFALSEFIEKEKEKEQLKQILKEKYGEIDTKEAIKMALKEMIEEKEGGVNARNKLAGI